MNVSKVLSTRYVKGAILKDVLRALERSSTTLAAEDVSFTRAKPFEQIPGFKSLPYIGTAWLYYPIIGKYKHEEAHIHDKDKYEMFGDIYRDVFSGNNLVSIFNQKDIETLVRSESKYPPRPFATTLWKYRNERRDLYKSMGVVLAQGQEWYNLRYKVQRHLMRPSSMDRYIDSVTAVAQDMINHIISLRDNNYEVKDTMNELFKWSLESVAFVALNRRLGCLDPNVGPDCDGKKLINAVQSALVSMNKMEYFSGSSIQLWKYFRTPIWKKFRKSMDTFTEIAFKHAQAAMDSTKGGVMTDEPNLILEMLSAEDLKPEEIMTMVTDMMLAGIDTTSHTAGFTLFHLAKNPEKQEKAYQEVLELLPSPSDKLTPEKIAQMRYLKMCFKEAMRLHPVARGLGRVTERDLVLAGHQVPAGTFVLALLPVTFRMEKYFKDADKFIPERWDKNEGQKPQPYVFLPFGFGTRSCIGRRIAELEVWGLLAEIIRNFKVEYHYEDFQIKNRLLNTPDRPLKFAFIDRK